MSVYDVLDVLGLLCLLAGALLCLAAGVGMLRFSDLLTRMHAGTKPQILGVVMVIIGVGLRTRSGLDVGMLVLIALFQMLTIPAGAHMVGRAGFRTGQIAPTDIHLGPREHDHAHVEDSTPDVAVGDAEGTRDTQGTATAGDTRPRGGSDQH